MRIREGWGGVVRVREDERMKNEVGPGGSGVGGRLLSWLGWAGSEVLGGEEGAVLGSGLARLLGAMDG